MLRRTSERGLSELYRQDPDRADAMIFGRQAYSDRRGFLRGAGLATMGALIGAAIPFHRHMPAGYIPVALAKQVVIRGKSGLMVLGDKPLTAETPAHLLDDPITPTEYHFIRNNGNPPRTDHILCWKLTIDGMVNTPLELTIPELKNKFEVITAALVLECAGNGRGFFDPPVPGEQWTVGGVGCAQWTGVRLADVLKAAGVQEGAVYTGHEGADTDLSGDPDKLPLSRGVPIDVAMRPENLIAFAMNGSELHIQNGAPLRLVVPGCPGSCSQKWLTRIWVRGQVHDGAKMLGSAYRVPNRRVAPGQRVREDDLVIAGHMPVKSLITSPATDTKVNSCAKVDSCTVDVRGHAWSGGGRVTRVEVSVDYGVSWRRVTLDKPINAGAWQNWRTRITLPETGYYEVWVRATDSTGATQPFVNIWNPHGYLGNHIHRIGVVVV